MLEALSSSSVPAITTFTAAQITSAVCTAVSQQFTTSSTVYHTSSVSLVKPTATQQPQGML